MVFILVYYSYASFSLLLLLEEVKIALQENRFRAGFYIYGAYGEYDEMGAMNSNVLTVQTVAVGVAKRCAVGVVRSTRAILRPSHAVLLPRHAANVKPPVASALPRP